jgi:puromycin-sensitive aminopeptidase
LHFSSAAKMTSLATRKAFSRLPTAIRPIKYHLRLKPDLAAFTFQGWMKVELDITAATDTIVCNAAELDVDYVRVGSLSGENVDKSCIRICEEAETMTVKLKKSLPVGKMSMFCAFRGTLNDQMRGFYRSKYTAENGEDRHCAVTQEGFTFAKIYYALKDLI